MTTSQVIVLDHVVALLGAAAWSAAAVTAALHRARLALVLLAAAGAATLARVGTVTLLGGRGWWFVQEKVLFGLPMPAVAGAAAVLLAAPRLREARSGDRAGLPVRSVVALFTAAYAALAGLGVTFLAGYPLTWGAALLAGSLVGMASLLTVRVLAVPAVPDVPARPVGSVDPVASARAAAPQGHRPEPSRRRFMGWSGALVLAAGGTGAGLSFRPAETLVTGGGTGPSMTRVSGASEALGPASRVARTVSVTELRGAPAPAPGGRTRRYVLTARMADLQLPSGRRIDGAWTYDGRVPGPPIVAEEGDLLEVRLRNADIEDGVTLHWHGYDVPCGEDGAPGVTQQPVAPGEEFGYRFRADQVGTYWYHTHQASHPGVRRGLYGTLVVKPRESRQEGQAGGAGRLDLTLPVHTFGEVVLLGDTDDRVEHLAPAGTSVRLRLINTDSDPHWCTLDGTRFRVVAVDGRDLHRPGALEGAGLRLPAGGRYDVAFVMPDRSVTLHVDGDGESGLRLRPREGEVGTPGPDPVNRPELDLLSYGEPVAEPFDAAAADRHFELVLDRGVAMVDGRPAYAQTVNGRGHPSIPDQLVDEGDLVRFTVVNRSLETHPWHLHGHPVLILSRDGVPASGSPLWVDTFDVRPGEVWEVAFRATNPGIWMNHCHNLPHAHEGMMLRLRYAGISTPFEGAGTGHRTAHS